MHQWDLRQERVKGQGLLSKSFGVKMCHFFVVCFCLQSTNLWMRWRMLQMLIAAANKGGPFDLETLPRGGHIHHYFSSASDLESDPLPSWMYWMRIQMEAALIESTLR